MRLGGLSLEMQPGGPEVQAQLHHARVYCLGQCFCLGLALCPHARPIGPLPVAGLGGVLLHVPVHWPCRKRVEGPGRVQLLRE